MDNKNYYVYLHRRNDTNDVFYVGKGRRHRATRKDGRNEWWHRVVNKAGGYTVEYAEKNLSEDDAFDLEIELIKFYRDCGYELCNLTNGGEGASGCTMSEENRKKTGDRHRGNTYCLGKKATPESRQRMSLARMGVPVSSEAKAKISLSLKGRKRCPVASKKTGIGNMKPVVCSNGMIFDGMREAAKWLNSIGKDKATYSHISSCCNGKRKTAYGFTWCFYSLLDE